MKNRTLGTCVNDNNYNKVIDYINLYNKETGKDLSTSEFIWDSIKFYVSYLRNTKGIK